MNALLTLPVPYSLALTAANVALVALLLFALARGSSLSRRDGRPNVPMVIGVGSVITIWGLIINHLASQGAFRFDPSHPFPSLGLAIAIPVVLGLIVMRRVRPLYEALRSMPQQYLIAMQAFRMLGIMFILVMARGELPSVFAVPAGIGDIITGAVALELAYLYDGSRRANRVVTLWNYFGLLDLIVAVSIGFFASLTPFRLIFSTPSTNLMTALPFAMIPMFAIPLYVLVHITSLRNLAASSKLYDAAGERFDDRAMPTAHRSEEATAS